MKQRNIKTPLVFRVGLVLLCVLIVTSNMTGDLYARYTTTVTGSASAMVARISYKFEPDLTNGELFISRHSLDTNVVPESCDVVAFEESFTLINDGDVLYEYILTLTLTHLGQSLSDYSLTSISSTAWVSSPDDYSTGVETLFNKGKFYYYENDSTTLSSADSPTLTGSLAAGEQVTYRILYFVKITAPFNQRNTLGYEITCTQKD